MTDDTRADRFGDGVATRDYVSVALVVCCVAAVGLATVLVPVASAYGLSGVPAESLVPLPEHLQQRSEGGAGSGGQLPSSATGSGFGALNVGQEQSVGGSLADENETSAFRSQNTAVHFVVQSPEPAYWRTGAYDTYTGDGWERSAPSDTSLPLAGREFQYRVELKQRATTAPTVWQPTRIEEGSGLSVTEGGIAKSDTRLSAGTTYVAVSRQPPREQSVLQASGRSYPAEIEQRYTELPEDTRERVAPFTSDLTANASSPYEAATRIENWLETNKEYSLNVSQEPDGNVAEQFIFEMERGYCEYFATSMVVMLRSQGIPARYAVGYSTGQQTGENTYTVRAMNAHAWVEVYFEDVGWVRFDPTPASERLQQERESFNEQESGTYAPEEEGSPGELASVNGTVTPSTEVTNETTTETEVTPGESTTEAPVDGAENETTGNESGLTTPENGSGTGADNGTDVGGGDAGDGDGSVGTGGDDASGNAGRYNVSLNRTAVPGATVEVTVTDDGVPVEGIRVYFNGEAIGVTAFDGTVAGTVPYASSLNVTLEPTWTDSAAVGGAASEPPPVGDDGGLAFAPSSGSDNHTEGDDSVSYNMSTDATVVVSGELTTGSEVVVTATVADVPVRNATVLLDGRAVAQTDGDGRARLRLPAEPGNVTVTVRRGPVTGSSEVRLAGLNATVEPTLGIALSGTPVRVVARMGADPAANATVRIGDDTVGRTGVNGTLTAVLPFQSSVPVEVAHHGQTVRTEVSDPLLNAAGVLVTVVAVGGLIVGIGYWRDVGPGALLSMVQSVTRGAYRGAVRVLVGVTFAVERAAIALAARTRRTVEHVRALLAGEQSLAETLAAFRAWLAEWIARCRAGLRGWGSIGSADGSDADGREADGSDARVTMREAWDRFLTSVSVPRAYTKTPGQLAAHAMSVDDLPGEAVRTLRDEFRAVEYGSRSPDASVDRVEAAIERIERATGDDGETGGQPTPGEGRAVDGDGPEHGPVRAADGGED